MKLDDIDPADGDVAAVASGYEAMRDADLEVLAGSQVLPTDPEGFPQFAACASGRAMVDRGFGYTDWAPLTNRRHAQELLDAMAARKRISAVAEEIMRARTGHHGIGYAQPGALCRHMLLATPREITIACLRAVEVGP